MHGTWYSLITGLITLLIIPLNGLIGVTPIICRVIIPVKVVTKSHGPPSRGAHIKPTGLGFRV